jgi:hypothetical protein
MSPLSGKVMCSDDDDDVVDRYFERRRLLRWREFDGRFWADRYPINCTVNEGRDGANMSKIESEVLPWEIIRERIYGSLEICLR